MEGFQDEYMEAIRNYLAAIRDNISNYKSYRQAEAGAGNGPSKFSQQYGSLIEEDIDAVRESNLRAEIEKYII